MVNIGDEDAFDKMVCVEGEEYREYKSKEAFGDCSFESFLEVWNGLSPASRNIDPSVGLDVNGTAAIYGLGGWNRYPVRSSGAIQFIASMSTEEYTTKARECGFDIV